MKFWVWFLRNIDETKKQIKDALAPQKEAKPKATPKQNNQSKKVESVMSSVPQMQRQMPQKQTVQRQQASIQTAESQNINSYAGHESVNYNNHNNQTIPLNAPRQNRSNQRQLNINYEQNQTENFIENFLHDNYLRIENKNKEEKGIFYSVVLQMNKLNVKFDCIYYYKKPNEAELIKFYTSSLKPKIVFIENCPKKLFNLSNNIENLTIINI